MDEPVAGKALWWTFPHAWQRCGSLALFWSDLGEQGKGGTVGSQSSYRQDICQTDVYHPEIPSGTETWISK